MLKIKDYLALKDIEQYLETKKDNLVRQENMYNDCEVAELGALLCGLRKILNKLENEE